MGMPDLDDAIWVYAEGSTNVERFRYLPAEDTGEPDDILQVWFKAKDNRPASLYYYFGVPEAGYRGMIAAASRGKYVRAYLRAGGFRYLRVV